MYWRIPINIRVHNKKLISVFPCNYILIMKANTIYLSKLLTTQLVLTENQHKNCRMAHINKPEIIFILISKPGQLK